jgi:hypothetical protein
LIQLPDHLWSYLTSRTIDFRVHLRAKSARSVWPLVEISVNHAVIYRDLAVDDTTISKQLDIDDDFVLRISLIDKPDDGTVIDDQGRIIENQEIEIISIVVNNVDLVSTGLIYRGIGSYVMNLTAYKKQQLEKYGQIMDQSNNLTMAENGTWTIRLKQPVFTCLARLWHQSEPVKKMVQDSTQIRKEMAEKILDCLRLQSDLEENISQHTGLS